MSTSGVGLSKAEREAAKKALERQRSVSKAATTLIKEELNRTTKHKKVLDRIRKSHMVQSEIKKEQKRAQSKLPQPSSCNPLLQNTGFVDDVRSKLMEEQAQTKSATRQVAADRRVRSLAKGPAVHSTPIVNTIGCK